MLISWLRLCTNNNIILVIELFRAVFFSLPPEDVFFILYSFFCPENKYTFMINPISSVQSISGYCLFTMSNQFTYDTKKYTVFWFFLLSPESYSPLSRIYQGIRYATLKLESAAVCIAVRLYSSPGRLRGLKNQRNLRQFLSLDKYQLGKLLK